MSLSIHSFDVFDTALTRIWARPTDLFWELGNCLQEVDLIAISSVSWSKLRVAAEQTARQASPTNEVTLAEIYHQLAVFLGWSEAQAAKAMQLEIQLEQSSWRHVPAIQQKIQALHQHQQQVTYLSDMYLPHEVIQSFLRNNQLWAAGDLLYVSGETGVNKFSGQLFKHYLAERSILPSQLHHTGDNLHSDVKVPRQLGIQSQPFLAAHLNRYEQLIVENHKLPLKFRSLVAGASRLCRLQSQETQLHKQVIWNTAANVIGPVLFGFVHWCLLEAKRRGIQRLYFVARDGQILWKIAQVICRKWGYEIDCRYFYGSRQAFHFPAIQSIGQAELDWMFASNEFLSVQDVCARVHLEPKQIASTLTQYGFLEEVWHENLNMWRRKLLQKVFQTEEVAKLIIKTAASYREKALGYFKQEGMGDEIPFALVDVGWTGNSQRSLGKLLAAEDIYPKNGLRGFYFGLTKNKKAFATDQLIPYFLSADSPSERLFLCPPEIIELFMAADHGSTLRYEKQSESYIPVLRNQKNERGLAWGLSVQQEAIVEFAEQLTNNLNASECKIDHFQWLTEDLLKSLIYSPSKEEAEAFGSLSFAQEQSETKFEDLAPIYHLSDCLQGLLNRHHIHNFAWLPASIQRSPMPAKLLLRYLVRTRYALNYTILAWQLFVQDRKKESSLFLVRALRYNPMILLSKRVIRLIAIHFARKLLSPENYKKLRSIVQLLEGEKLSMISNKQP
jgi:predicted HAD superfamily hydrolase